MAGFGVTTEVLNVCVVQNQVQNRSKVPCTYLYFSMLLDTPRYPRQIIDKQQAVQVLKDYESAARTVELWAPRRG